MLTVNAVSELLQLYMADRMFAADVSFIFC